MDNPLKHIVILGGGSAGWLTAGRLAAQMQQREQQLQISLIESPTLSTIGVGEGSWPSLRHTLRQIGISELTFLVRCQASFKQGSKFIGWRNETATGHYYHPFTNPVGYTEINGYQHWQSSAQAMPFADVFCPQPAVCEAGRAPKQLATPEYAQVVNYGYHFDADKLAELLTEHCTQQLGVNHIRDHIEQVECHPNGDIRALIGQQNGPITADFFIDCSGMASRLIGQHYAIPWQAVTQVLPSDSAIAVQVPYAQNDSPIQSTTNASAKPNGWIWDIGLYHRRGVGFAYASGFCDKAQAEHTLLDHLRQQLSEEQVATLTPRHLKFTPGYRKKCWQNNCLAIGMSAGFIEPLEASAIAMVELSINMLCEEFPQTRRHMDILSQRFNKRFDYRWQRVIDFVKLHYVLNKRQDSEFWSWQRQPESIPDSLQTLLALWQFQTPSRLDFIENEEVFTSASYQYVLYGMGAHSQQIKDNNFYQSQPRANTLMQQTQNMKQQLLQGLPENRSLLSAIRQKMTTEVVS
ncbi:tryptophan halogenase family protein [Planctobacterium marinum]|uniref:tryptophan halogenase family protein n=1 Tax=Planctobacterium marinum TaxID=1631968 RepID=UPI001E3E2697|nr:tryptophan halogenase family protein [Planctobacterium marinum]MCC2606709.1 tryptophan 7-halogenase [Planctobacterium marinum]